MDTSLRAALPQHEPRKNYFFLHSLENRTANLQSSVAWLTTNNKKLFQVWLFVYVSLFVFKRTHDRNNSWYEEEKNIFAMAAELESNTIDSSERHSSAVMETVLKAQSLASLPVVSMTSSYKSYDNLF